MGPGGPPGYPPYRPPSSGRPGWLVPLVACGALLAVAVLVGAVLFVVHARSARHQGGHQAASTAATSPPASSSPSPSAAPTFSTLPDACSLGGSKPRRTAGLTGDGDNGDVTHHHCRWEVYHSDKAMDLDVTMDLSEGSDGTDDATRTFRDDLRYSGDSGDNGGYRKNPRAVQKLGDDAFTAQVDSPVVYGETEQDAKTYNMGGAMVEVRARNVVLEVKWVAATYPGGAGNGRTLTGTNLGYDEARKQAVAVARHLVDALR